jgi:GntR family transcriptional repressor for pyruvate dehydrogenase complex
LREALRCLSIMGVLKARVGEGTSVAVDGSKFMETVLHWRLLTEQDDIENLMEVRIALEGVAAAGAARRGNEKDLQHLQDLLKKMEASIGDAKKFAALDLDFHLGLAKASENQLILDLVSMIRGQLERGVTKVLLVPQAMPLSLKEHTAILQAVKRKEPEAARAAMQAHLDAAVHRYQKAIEKEHRA